MNQCIRFLLMAAVPLSLVRAADTGVWDFDNNTVTYSASVDNISLGVGDVAGVSHSQFITAWAAAQGGGSASDYTLLYAVLTPDGTLHGTGYNGLPIEDYPELSGDEQSGSLDLVGLANDSNTRYYGYTPAPEPSAFSLLALGCATLLARRRRHRKIAPLHA